MGEPSFHRLMKPFVVWGIWAGMFLAALGYVARYGSNVPSWDEWDIVPTMTGEQPITVGWLWSQHNEHRIPVPRLVMLALYRLFGPDFRVSMYFNVVSMAALAAAMILAARHLRGGLSYSDAFFPVLLLNWGQGVNLLWGWQLEFFSSTVLAGIVLLLIVLRGNRPSPGIVLAIGLCLVLLTGCGAHGVALVPALALWLLVCAVLRWRSPEARAKRDSLLMLVTASAALLLVGLYFVGYEKVPYHPISYSHRATLSHAVKFCALGFSPAAKSWWKFSGVAVLAVLMFTSALLGLAVVRQPGERRRALGLLAFLGAMASLALGLGSGRDGFEPRYVTLSVPIWCCVYFAIELYGPPRVNPWARLLLLGTTLVALWPNTAFGLEYGSEVRSRLGSLERDMEAGMPGYLLIHRHAHWLHADQKVPTDYMPLLRRAGVGSFRCLNDDPAFEEISLPLEPSFLSEVKWQDGTAYAAGSAPYLEFALPKDRYVCGIRIKYQHSNETNTLPYVYLSWKSQQQADFTREQSWKQSPTGDRANWEKGSWLRLHEPETTMLVWVCDKVGVIRLYPDFKPCTFRISEIVLLVSPQE